MAAVPVLEPIAAVGDPPGNIGDRDGRAQGPPERQKKIGEQAEDDEREPEDLALHVWIVKRGLRRF